MNNELRPYDEYKKAPFPWLDSIPMHWQYKRGKAMYLKANRLVRENDEVVTCFRDGMVTLRKNRRTTGFTESIKEIGYQGIRKGDLVIHVMDAFAGAVGVSDSDGKSTPVYSVCVPKENLNNYYYAYIVREMAKTGFIQSLYRGIRERSSDFRFDVFANQYLPIPSIEEQNQIVKYLDFQLAKTNKFIKAKKKLIEALKEQKQAVINEAVTKGINPDVKMKPSGIDWLGDIPEHWEKKRFKNIVSINGRIGFRGYTQADIVDEGEGAITLSPGNIKNNKLDLGNLAYISWNKYYESPEIMVEKNDIILVKTGSSFGKATLINNVETPMTINPQLVVLKKCKVNSSYFANMLISNMFMNQISRKIIGGATPTIGQGVLGSILFYVPDMVEQESILEYIIQKTELLNKSIEVIEKEIQLITEYRTSLISDVVTGKVDVRNIKIDEILNDEIELEAADDEIIEGEEDIEIEESGD